MSQSAFTGTSAPDGLKYISPVPSTSKIPSPDTPWEKKLKRTIEDLLINKIIWKGTEYLLKNWSDLQKTFFLITQKLINNLLP